MKQTTNLDGIDGLSDYFRQVSAEHPEEWLPLYYSALCKLILTFRIPDSTHKMQLIALAQVQIDRALQLQATESELVTLQGLLYQATIIVDPVKNGGTYAYKAKQEFDRARNLDATNPRPVYLQALSIMYTPVQYGGGTTAACPLLQSAQSLFEAFVPKGTLYPKWGAEDCRYFLNYCNQ